VSDKKHLHTLINIVSHTKLWAWSIRKETTIRALTEQAIDLLITELEKDFTKEEIDEINNLIKEKLYEEDLAKRVGKPFSRKF